MSGHILKTMLQFRPMRHLKKLNCVGYCDFNKVEVIGLKIVHKIYWFYY